MIFSLAYLTYQMKISKDLVQHINENKYETRIMQYWENKNKYYDRSVWELKYPLSILLQKWIKILQSGYMCFSKIESWVGSVYNKMRKGKLRMCQTQCQKFWHLSSLKWYNIPSRLTALFYPTSCNLIDT